MTSPAIPEPHLEAWRAVLNAHTAVVAHSEAALAAGGLPPLAWYDVLWALRRAPGRRLRMAELAESLTISRGGLTKLADRLEAAGLLRREPAADDGRRSGRLAGYVTDPLRARPRSPSPGSRQSAGPNCSRPSRRP